MRLRGRVALVLTLLSAAPAPALRAQGPAGLDVSQIQLPQGFLDLSDVLVYGGADGGFNALATTSFFGSTAEVLVSIGGGTGGPRQWLLAIQPQNWSLTEAIPALANPVLEGLALQGVTLVVTNRDVILESANLPDDEYWFYQAAFQKDDFTLTLKPGVNLFGTIPTENLPADHPLRGVMDALGIEQGGIFLQGTLGQSLTLLTNPAASGLDVIKDLYLRADLPPMRPVGAPAWFRHGQLSLELTGLPSVRLVGEIGVTIDAALLDFFLAAQLARTGVSLAGGLRAEGGWKAPFGIEWLIINELIFKLGITPTGSIEPGFAGKLVIGQKDIAIAVALAISPAGVPTNFIFEGESKEGFGIADLVELQARMRAARDAAAQATGVQGPLANTRIPLDALPDLSLKEVALKFAPKPSPELGVERGFAIKGDLWVAPPGGPPRSLAGVDVNVGEDGFWARGRLAAFTLGPLVWDDALLDLTMTPEDQHLFIKGQVQLFSFRQLVDLELSRQHLRFRTETEIYNLFSLAISCEAAFNLQQPAFRLHGVAQADFGDVLQPIVRSGLVIFVGGAEVLVAQADAVLTGLDRALGAAEWTVQQLRAALEQLRQGAYNTWQAAAQSAAQTYAAALDAQRRRDAAYRLWYDTPYYQAALKTQRYMDWLYWVAVHSARSAAYAAQALVAEGARRVYVAIPAPDENVAIQRAEDAVRRLRAQVAEARAQLTELRNQLARLNDALQRSDVAFAIRRAEVAADLEAMRRGDAVRWSIAGVFLDEDFLVERTLNFSNATEAVSQMVKGLLGW